MLLCSPSKAATLSRDVDPARIDDEHRLIARYAARLAADANHAVSGTRPNEKVWSVPIDRALSTLIDMNIH